MKIRFARPEDIDTILDLGAAMIGESRFCGYGLNRDKTRRVIEVMVGQPENACVLLAQRDAGEVSGMLAGYIVDYFFCDAVVAQDRWFYVKPEYRGSPAAFKLLLAFRRWAEGRRVSELNINMSVAIDMARFNKFMSRLGFSCCGSNFSLALANGRE